MFFPHLIKILFMVIKEYYFSGDKKDGKTLSIKAVLMFYTVALVICLFVAVYLREQASQNLTIHKQVIDQNINLKKQNMALLEDNAKYKAELGQCMVDLYGVPKPIDKK